MILMSLLFLVASCGFHLRGSFSIPTALQILRLAPNQPLDPFQRPLRQALKSNSVQIVDDSDPNVCNVTSLIILSQSFFEKTVGYGSDGQVNRVIIQFTVHYQITDPQGKVIIPSTAVQVERSLTVIPNAVLGTDYERAYVTKELYSDAASQLLRQLSVLSIP